MEGEPVTSSPLQDLEPRLRGRGLLRLLHVGSAGPDVDSLLTPLGSTGLFDQVVSTEAGPGLANASRTIEAEGLRVGKGGCLVVLWDLDALVPDGGKPEVLSPSDGWATHLTGFAFTRRDPELSFLELVRWIKVGSLAYLGNVEGCQQALLAWCRAEPAVPPSLQDSFHRTPATWLRHLKHDYLKGVIAMRIGNLPAEVAEDQWEIDHWQHWLRNALLTVTYKVQARAFPEHAPRSASPIPATPFCPVVPPWLVSDLTALGQHPERDFVVAEGAGAAVELARQQTERGAACVLLWEHSLDPPELPGLPGGADRLPVILVRREHPPRMLWTRWQSLLQRNVLGGFSHGELQADQILDAPASTWRRFCFRSLGQTFDLIAEGMAKTFVSMEEELGDKGRTLLACIREVQAARKLFLGHQ